MKFVNLVQIFKSQEQPPAFQWQHHISGKTGTRWQDTDQNPSMATKITLDTKSVPSILPNPSRFAVSSTFGLVDTLDQSHQRASSGTNRDDFLFCDASMTGYGVHLDQHTLSAQWSEVQRTLHINVLELQTVWIGLRHFQRKLQNSTVVVMTDNTSTVAYLNNQGGTKSRHMCQLAEKIQIWAEQQYIWILFQHIPGHLNVLADSLSCQDQVIPS